MKVLPQSKKKIFSPARSDMKAGILFVCAAIAVRGASLRARRPLPSARAGRPKRRGVASGGVASGGVASGGVASGGEKVVAPSYGWAILHNWLYFLSLGLCIPVLPRVIASAVNEDGSPRVSAASARVGGDVEGVDKLLTFLFVGTLGALSDTVGRTPLIALSALGYLATILVQARATRVWHFFLADSVDGLTSCMNAVCGAYVADATAAEGGAAQAAALGLFQGLSTGGAFCVGFPLAGVLSKRGRIRRPMYVAAALQGLNAVLALLATPESTTARSRAAKRGGLDRADCNPVTSLGKLDFFARGKRRAGKG